MTQGEALTILKTGANVFLTGSPGSGKTHTINGYIEWLRSCGIEPSVTAATGIAATHVGGMTLHAWSGIGILDLLSPADIDRIAGKEHVVRRIQKAKTLIIDEISMLSASTLEAADAVCREVRRDTQPFGGLQVILVGDFFQLPPIAKPGRETKFAYESQTWRALNPLICYLTEQHRQDDADFLSLLGAIRDGEVEELHYEHLSTRRIAPDALPENMPKLYSHNADVDRLNAAELDKLPGNGKRFLMSSKGKDAVVEGLKRGCLSPELLELKKGAVVMFTKNSPQGQFVNGTLGTVVEFESSGFPVVETRDGTRITAEPMEWQVEEQGKVLASVSQVPLRLAWAMTVHKSQGMSMDAAVIDLSRAFEYGQGYVALSRVRRLSGVHLLGINERALAVHPEVLEQDRSFREASAVAAHTFADMPKREVEDMQKNFVKAMGGAMPTESNSAKKQITRTKKAMPGRLAETLSAVREAKSLEAAASARALSVGTVVKHLEELANVGAITAADFKHLLPREDVLAEIAEAFTLYGDERLAPVFSAFRGEYSYDTIRLARLAHTHA